MKPKKNLRKIRKVKTNTKYVCINYFQQKKLRSELLEQKSKFKIILSE